MKVYGMLTVEELQQQVDSREIDTVLVVFTDLYGRFMGKRFDAEFFLEDAVENGTHCCDYLVTVDMEMDPVSGYEYTNWERGYGEPPARSNLYVATELWAMFNTNVLCRP